MELLKEKEEKLWSSYQHEWRVCWGSSTALSHVGLGSRCYPWCLLTEVDSAAPSFHHSFLAIIATIFGRWLLWIGRGACLPRSWCWERGLQIAWCCTCRRSGAGLRVGMSCRRRGSHQTASGGRAALGKHRTLMDGEKGLALRKGGLTWASSPERPGPCMWLGRVGRLHLVLFCLPVVTWPAAEKRLPHLNL